MNIWIVGVIIGASTWAGLLLAAGLLHALPYLSKPGRRVSAALCRAPCLDFVLFYFVILPLIIGPVFAGWVGLLAAIIGQVAAVRTWCRLHEMAHRKIAGGPRIVTSLNKIVGRWRNHAALWTMAPAAPLFWLVRLTQMLVYPPLTWLVGLPKYKTGEWVNLSRQKTVGLVGHDLIWCLYCDWMTGLWSLGSEMLRNIESLWCPLRFASEGKCANCQITFPDVNGTDTAPGWADPNEGMEAVTKLIEQQYGQGQPRGWFAHPARLTVNGKEVLKEQNSGA